MSWSINFRSPSKKDAVAVMLNEKFSMPDSMIAAITQAIAALPEAPGKYVQVICHGNVGEGVGNVNIMVALVST